jgi:hypothetical protein
MRPPQKKSTHQPKANSEKRNAELRAAGLRYNGEKSGHVDRNCPNQRRVKSGQTGVFSDNAELEGKRDNSCVHVERVTVTVETMSLGAIHFDLLPAAIRTVYAPASNNMGTQKLETH